MSRLGFANIYELLDESDSSGVESGKKAQEAFEKKNAAAAAALAPTPTNKPAPTQKPAGERRQGGNSEFRGPRTDRPRGDRPPRAEGDRPRGDRPPRAEGDRPRGDRPRGDRPYRPRPAPGSPQLEGGEASFSESGQAAAAGAPRSDLPRGQKGGPRGDRGYERRRTGDQDQRPRREYDRHSGTGRGKEVSKGGSGKGNWGSVEDETKATVEGSAAEVAAEEDVKHEKEEGAAEAPAAAETPAAAEEDAEPPVRTLEDYLKERKKVAADLPAPRRAGEGEDQAAYKGYTPFTREEETLFSVDRSAKDKKSKDSKETSEKKVSADQVLRFQEKERRDRDDRKGGRGGQGKGQQQGGKRTGGAAPNFGDQSAFPTLSTKA